MRVRLAGAAPADLISRRTRRRISPSAIHIETWNPSTGELRRSFSNRIRKRSGDNDPRLTELGKELAGEFAHVKDHYGKNTKRLVYATRQQDDQRHITAAPKNPIVLAHGLLGFAELKLAGGNLSVEYWHGIKDALTANNVQVITPSVPPSGSICERAEKLSCEIADKAHGRRVNIIAHSMGGLDARYMISNLRPAGVRVASLVTIATPHRGSAFADYLLEGAYMFPLPRLYGILEKMGLGTAAFSQLTRRYMAEDFNPSTPERADVRYFSYGAAMSRPPILSPFRLSHRVLEEAEGPNDGLVSVESSKYGTYKGTLVSVSHLDLINWSNRLRWTIKRWLGEDRT